MCEQNIFSEVLGHPVAKMKLNFITQSALTSAWIELLPPVPGAVVGYAP